jgi:FAD/FMN-containing dehydrogenase
MATEKKSVTRAAKKKAFTPVEVVTRREFKHVDEGIKNKLAGIVGVDRVVEDQQVLEEYSRDHSDTPPCLPAAVVFSGSKEEIREIIKLANTEGFPLIPISSGTPRFRGDTVPMVESAVIVDMSKMNQVITVDRRNRVAVIEPGVTFGELEKELEEEGLRLSMPLCPKSTKAVITAAMEREPMTTPRFHWDITDPLACTELLVGEGESLFTGEVGATPGTPEEQLERGYAFVSPGGNVFNMIKIGGGSQGSLGICAWASVRCELMPDEEELYVVEAKSLEELVGPANRLLYTRLADDLFILNALNMACLLKTEPEAISDLAAQLPPWIMVFTVGGYGVLPEDMLQYKLEELEGMGIPTTDSLPGATREDIIGLLRRPSQEPYWKLRLKGDARELFFQTSLAKAPSFVGMVQKMVEDKGLSLSEMGIYVQPQRQGTHCHVEFDLYFSPQHPAEAKMVAELISEAAQKAFSQGGYFSRPYGEWADMVYDTAYADIASYLRGIKQIFDPEGIMSPGRLCF